MSERIQSTCIPTKPPAEADALIRAPIRLSEAGCCANTSTTLLLHFLPSSVSLLLQPSHFHLVAALLLPPTRLFSPSRSPLSCSNHHRDYFSRPSRYVFLLVLLSVYYPPLLLSPSSSLLLSSISLCISLPSTVIHRFPACICMLLNCLCLVYLTCLCIDTSVYLDHTCILFHLILLHSTLDLVFSTCV